MTGRPPRGKRAATKVLRVRLNDAEWLELEKRAAKAGLGLSEYVRAKVLG